MAHSAQHEVWIAHNPHAAPFLFYFIKFFCGFCWNLNPLARSRRGNLELYQYPNSFPFRIAGIPYSIQAGLGSSFR